MTETVAAARTDRWHAFVRSPLVVASSIWLLLITAGSLFAPVIAPYDPTSTDLINRLVGPTAQHLLGTDQLGRDVLSRILFAGTDALLGVVEATAVFVLLGVLLGVIAGYFGGWVDWIVTRWNEIVVALPAVLILLVVLAVFPRNQSAAMLTFGVLASPGLARVIRAQTLTIRDELYVSAARVAGLSDGQILRRHIVSRLGTTIILQAAILAAVALVVQAGLSFLGLGVQDPQPSWGGLINQAAQVLNLNPWMIVPTGGVIALTVLSLGIIGDFLRDSSANRLSRHGARKKKSVAKSVAKPVAADGVTPDGVTPPSSALLSVRNLTVAFEGAKGLTEVVQNVSFTVNRGEAIGIVGESGCGKSVTVTAILGLLGANATAHAQSCAFDGTEILNASQSTLGAIRGRRIGYISQEPMTALDPTVKVGSLIAEAVRHHHKLTRADARVRAIELLRDVNLANPEAVAGLYPHQISGGMAQRVAIALSLAGEPDLLIADEPTTALDVTVQAEILALLRSLQTTRGLAIVLITHDWGVVAQLCARAVVMYAGQIIEQGSSATLYRETAHPYTAGLLAANPHFAMQLAATTSGARPLRLPSIPGTVPSPDQWPTSCHFASRCPLATADCTSAAIPLSEVPNDASHLSRCIRIADVKAKAAR